MINLRYHIVSITAVFLALAIGLALGSTLLERATVGTLNDRLDAQAERLDKTDGENAQLRRDIAAQELKQQEIYGQARALFGGQLEDRWVLIVAEQGTRESLLEDARSTLALAGASVSGVLQISSRWSGLSPEEAETLGSAVGLNSDNETVVRSIVLKRVADELRAAATKPTSTEDALEIDGVENSTAVDSFNDEMGPVPPSIPQFEDSNGELVESDRPEVPEAPTITTLTTMGYLEFFGDDSGIPLPDFDLRIVVLVDDRSALKPPDFMSPLLRALTRAGDAPALVLGDLTETSSDETRPSVLAATMISEVRGDSYLVERLSTVDNLNEFTGQASLVLALRNLFSDAVSVGHYGRAAGSNVLIPQLGTP